MGASGGLKLLLRPPHSVEGARRGGWGGIHCQVSLSHIWVAGSPKILKFFLKWSWINIHCGSPHNFLVFQKVICPLVPKSCRSSHLFSPSFPCPYVILITSLAILVWWFGDQSCWCNFLQFIEPISRTTICLISLGQFQTPRFIENLAVPSRRCLWLQKCLFLSFSKRLPGIVKYALPQSPLPLIIWNFKVSN